MTHTCPVEGCRLDVPRSHLMCWDHWCLVPKPIQSDVYYCYRRRPGGPSHLAAMKRAIESVNRTIEGRANREQPASMPYRDD
ncbi:MAG TPA: hypothetical protein VJS69_05040 [Candidatus Krumholzibacteria bacterium]|nr:hypothetical protein [Candidatus Krumholzibacteria bacterium]